MKQKFQLQFKDRIIQIDRLRYTHFANSIQVVPIHARRQTPEKNPDSSQKSSFKVLIRVSIQRTCRLFSTYLKQFTENKNKIVFKEITS